MNKDAKTINERWYSCMNGLCTRIHSERTVFNDAVYSRYHEAESTSFCKGVSFGLYLAISMVEGYAHSVYENCSDFEAFVVESELEGGAENG